MWPEPFLQTNATVPDYSPGEQKKKKTQANIVRFIVPLHHDDNDDDNGYI